MRITTAQTPEDTTQRVDLYRPVPEDAEELHILFSDPRLWTHFPSLRHTSREQTTAVLDRWIAGWDALGLGVWVARDPATRAVLGYGGASSLGGEAWNVGYRLAIDAQGRGLATELASRAMSRAQETHSDWPVVAYLLEHNHASAAVARKLGLTLVDRTPDAGNPDESAIRLIFADRELTDRQLAAARA